MEQSPQPADLALSTPLSFLKGEGTANDFVVMADLDGLADPSPAFVRALCDRRRGLGGDGLLRITRPSSPDSGASYFMDYRNADGTTAEMCGNGARVFAVALRRTGLVSNDEFLIETRGGLRSIQIRADGSVSVGMGLPTYAVTSGLQCDVTPSLGRAVWMPNPHAVFTVDDLESLDLTRPPEVWPESVFPNGVNVEFVAPVGPHHIRMRVYERGVGETLSCGTGACAAAVSSALSVGEGPGKTTWRVDVPGGTLTVTWGHDDLYLSGSASIVASGEIDSRWVDVVE